MKKLIATVLLGTLGSLPAAQAAQTTQLGEVVVKGTQEVTTKPAVEGTKIYSGKKTEVIDLDAAPTIINSNYRQVLQKTPGLLLSEESTPLFSVGYRGLDPNRAQFIQVLKDGVPITADMVGYPEAYYVPPTQVIDHIDFVKGGASLLYGPQPGGALNFVTRDPYDGSPLRIETENSWGSHDLYSHYTSLSGTQGDLGYYAYLHHRQGQGFRQFNSQFDVLYGGAKAVYEQDAQTRWTLIFDAYEETHGEPGGLTRAQFDLDPSVSTKLIDRFELNRYSLTGGLEKDLSEATQLDAKVYGVYYERLSWRQRGGGFGTAPTGATASTNDIESQEFYTGGADIRVRRDYDALGHEGHTLTAGVTYHHTDSPRTDSRGTTADAEDGSLRKDTDRTTDYLSVFAENLFKLGRLSITPSVRLENIWQDVVEHVNLDKTAVPLADENEYDLEPLAGVGVNYEVTDEMDVYANFSQGYRPKIFTQAVPSGTNQVVNTDLQAGRSWQTDLGLKGDLPQQGLRWDVSWFFLAFDDQIGSATVNGQSSVQNVGDAEHTGVELFAEQDLVRLWDNWTGSSYGESFGQLGIFAGGMALDAEFVGGPNKGKTPQYAPDYLLKTGVEYRHKDLVKVRLGGTFSDDHYADDNNTSTRYIPSYKVWDLMTELKLWGPNVSVFGGVNNLFDEDYFSRVRGDGIDPSDGRNYYAGVRVIWG
ncbi:MAG: Fe(3+) dicitrate transport protein FecA [Candidatus Omnitrophica bacterium]|nr:Fe(3+) dicitrate transport protein FecA [Candidatus Omnitrophota bacterium]